MKYKICFILLFCAVELVTAQHTPPAPKPNGPPPVGLPIDSGIVWLFVLGCVIGIIEYNRKSIKQ
jgi:hypothetical protein